MRVALIGSSSFLGQAIHRNLEDLDAQILSISRSSSLVYDYPDQPITGLMPSLLNNDVIIYCSAAGVQPDHRDSVQLIYGLNTFEPLRLIQLLEEHRYQGQLISFGSYFSLGENNLTGPVDELYLLQHSNPQPNIYCDSKKWFSRLSDNYMNLTFAHLHLVLTNIYGPGENEHRLFPYLKRALDKNETPELTSGIQERQFTYVADVADFIVEGIKSQRRNGVFHLSNPKVVQVKGAVKEFYHQYNLRNGTVHQPNFGAVANKRDSSMDYLALDCSKAFTTFGRPKFTSLSEGLKTYL
ncbi:MAG: NAD(P)-dependent oxidoreductase [Vicingaceae bacterium]